jgi:hypothetical protein
MTFKSRAVVAIMLTLASLPLGSSADAATRPGPSRVYDPGVDLTTLEEADFKDFIPGDYAKLPQRVRDAITTPVETVAVNSRISAGRPTHGGSAVATAVQEQCYTGWRTVYRNNALGWHLMTVQNKEYGCGDGVYFTEEPINLSSAKGSYGWVFSSWRDYTDGSCNSSHLSWVQILTARFKFGITSELASLSNITTFFGSGGQHAGGC